MPPAGAQADGADDAQAREVLVVVNANAGATRRAAALVEAIEQAAGDARVSAPVIATRSTGELERTLLAADGRRVVLVGGDGTLHAAANLADPLPDLALLPAGTANNIARAVGIPTDPAAAAETALRAPARPIDLLRVEARGRVLRCIEGLSAGFQAAARASYHAVNSADLRAGARSLVRGIREYRPWLAEVEVDGRVEASGELAQVFVSNMERFGLGFKVNPGADPADGRIEAITATADSRRELAGLLARAYRGTHLDRRGVALRRGRRVAVRGELPLVGDSEPLGVGEAVVSVEAGALRLASRR